jgi:hypothetical protein
MHPLVTLRWCEVSERLLYNSDEGKRESSIVLQMMEGDNLRKKVVNDVSEQCETQVQEILSF